MTRTAASEVSDVKGFWQEGLCAVLRRCHGRYDEIRDALEYNHELKRSS